MKSVACSPRGVCGRSWRTRRATCSTTSPPEQGGLESVCMESRRPRVLVVDDERHIVDLVAMGLEGRGMEVRGALDGAAALKDLEEFRPDVLGLDRTLRSAARCSR